MSLLPTTSQPANQPEEHLLAARMIGFIDHLRLNNFVLGPAETSTALQVTADALEPLSEIRSKLKVLLSGREEEWRQFDDLFEAYWQKSGREREKQVQKQTRRERKSTPASPLWRNHLQDGDAGDGAAPQIESEGEGRNAGEASGRLIASHKQSLFKTDLRQFVDATEIAEAEKLAYRLAVAMRYRLSRRHRLAKRGRRLDLRRTIRRSLAHGGEPLHLSHLARPELPVNITIFLDVSGSMKHYSRFFLQFMKGLVGQWSKVDAYLFHTRLLRVTDLLKDRNAMRAMSRLSLMAEGFGGGTRLGESLAQFNQHYARQSLNSRSVVIILSDAYDTGEPELLAKELARLKKRAPKLIWLNPLLGWRNYAPVNRAIIQAMPYIDYFAAANTLESLAALEPRLAKL